MFSKLRQGVKTELNGKEKKGMESKRKEKKWHLQRRTKKERKRYGPNQA